jgi:membrane fusion protein (multidrug efflux system)
MKIKHFIYLALILLLGYLILKRITKSSDAGSGGKKSFSDKNKSIPPIVVNGVIIKIQPFSNSVSVSGSIDPNEQVQIRSEVSGLVTSINFKEGSYVSKGTLLLKIDDRELQAQLAQAVTRQNLAAENDDRSAKLLKVEALSVEEYQSVHADLRSLQAQTQLIRAQLSKTKVWAPFSGKIGLRNISDGAYVTPTTDIANLVSTNPLKITFSVPEKYAHDINNGSIIKFTVSGSSKTYSAKVYAAEPSINVATRTLVLKALANNSDGSLLPGTFANITLPLENIKDAILIPTESIVPVLKGKQVFVKVNGKAKAVMVESDIRTDENVLITSGLKPGDTLLTSGMMSLKNDAPVKVNLQ